MGKIQEDRSHSYPRIYSFALHEDQGGLPEDEARLARCEVEDGGRPREEKPSRRKGGDRFISPLFSLQPLLQQLILGLKLREASTGFLEAF